MIQTGTKVTYTSSRKNNNGVSVNFSSHEGTLLEYSESICRIKTKNGKTTWANTKTVRPVGQCNALTEAILGKE